MKVTGASHTQHHPSHGEELVWPSLGTLSLLADRDPHRPATLPGSSPDFVLPLSPMHPELPARSQAGRTAPFPFLTGSWPLLGVGQAVGWVLGLSLWGDGGGCGPALASPPTSLPLGPSLCSLRPASGHRTSTLPHRADAPHPSRPE